MQKRNNHDLTLGMGTDLGLVPIATDSPVNEPALVIGSLCCKYTSASISSIYIKFDTLLGSCLHQHHGRGIDIIMYFPVLHTFILTFICF